LDESNATSTSFGDIQEVLAAPTRRVEERLGGER
jgi:hypothetical protein